MHSKTAEKRNEPSGVLIAAPISVEKKSGISMWETNHFHEDYELSLFEHCDARVFLKDSWYAVRDGDVVFFPRNAAHRIQYFEVEQYTRMVISFRREFVMKILQPMGCESLITFYDSIHAQKAALIPGQFRQALETGNRLLAACRQLGESAEHETAALSTLYILLHGLRPAFENSRENSPLPQMNHVVKRVIDYIDAQYANEIRITDLAAMVHIDKHYLCHLFKRHAGTSLITYLQFRRIIESQKLLIYSGASIDTVAARCGFNNIQHFYKVFRNITGYAPMQYRTQKKLGEGSQTPAAGKAPHRVIADSH